MIPTPTGVILISAVSGDVVIGFTGAAGVDHYDVYRSQDISVLGIQINTVGIAEPSSPYQAQFDDNGINSISAPIGPGVFYYKVVAVDVDGDQSLPSDVLIVPLDLPEQVTPQRVSLISVEVRGN